MSRLFLCGITSNETEKISDLISKTKDYVDGYVWCVDSNSNSDETYKLLEENKKEGKIVRHHWWNAHDSQMNEFLHCGLLKNGDFYWIFDSSECPTEKWLKEIRNDIKSMQENGIGIIGCSGRAYLVEFQDTHFFQFTPHWFLSGVHNKKMILIQEDKKSEFIINKRELNPDKHYQEHDTKYYLYARSNQIQAFYGKYGQQIVNYHEDLRLSFREHLRKETGLEPSLRALNMLFKKCKEEFNSFERSIIELEFCLSEYYQRTVLGMNFMGIRPDINNGMHPRYKWSFENYLKFGDGWHDKDYMGTILRYNKQFNVN